MALRDQPYIPLYIQDFLTDEKLIECSASTTGVYVRLMCIMHKSDEYGKILLKQKDKQTDKQINNFALKVAKQLPYDLPVIIASLTELLDENVLYVDGDYLCQKRMISDNELSIKRSEAGSKGGKNNIKNNKEYKYFAKAKMQANTEDENENENENENKDRGVGKGFFKPDENYSVELSEMDTGKAIEYISHTKHISATKELVSGLWGAFKVKNFTGEKTYKNDRDIIRHFFESLKFVVLNEKRVTKTNKSVGKTIEFDKP